MRILRKLAAALAVVLAISMLSACRENENVPAQGTAPQSTTSESKPAPESSAPISVPASSSEPEQSVPTTTPPETSLSDGFPENPSEASLNYYEDAVGIVDKYLCTVMGNNDEMEQLGFDDLDYESPEDMKKVVQYVIDCANWGEGYLDELEKLTPTEEMSAFHSELVSLMNILRGYTDIARSLENVDITNDPAAENEFNKRFEKLLERFNKEYRAFYVKYPGFGATLAKGEWQKNGSTIKFYFEPDLRENAKRDAERIYTAVVDWSTMLNDITPLANATLEIVKTKNDCEITGAAFGDKELQELKQTIYSHFLLPDEYWARVYSDADGYPICVLLSPDGKLDESELNSGAGFESNLREWRGTGVTSEGHIIGILGPSPTDEPQ